MEQLIAHEPAWRAAHEAARIERLMARLGDPEARIAALLRREQVWHAAQLEQARQLLERATGQAHTFATTARVAGHLVDRVELAGEAFGRVRDRPNQLVLYHFQGILVHPAQRHTPVCWGVTAGCTSIYQIWYQLLVCSGEAYHG